MIRKRGLYTLRNYEYYLLNNDRLNELLYDVNQTNNIDILQNKYGVDYATDNHSGLADFIEWLLKEQKPKVEVVELRDIISLLTCHSFDIQHSCNALKRILNLWKDTNPKCCVEFGVSKECCFEIIKQEFTEEEYTAFLEWFNHLLRCKII